MYVCMCACIHVCMYVYKNASIYISTYICIHVHTHTHTIFYARTIQLPCHNQYRTRHHFYIYDMFIPWNSWEPIQVIRVYCCLYFEIVSSFETSNAYFGKNLSRHGIWNQDLHIPKMYKVLPSFSINTSLKSSYKVQLCIGLLLHISCHADTLMYSLEGNVIIILVVVEYLC
mgnify:CR=1 FL=1